MKIKYIDFHRTSPSNHLHIQSIDSNDFLQIKDLKNLFFIGPHPWNIRSYNLTSVKENLLQAKEFKNFCGIGEVGLDRAKNDEIEEQIVVLKSILEFAHQNKINTILLHCVKAYNEMLELIKLYQHTDLVFIFHDFNANQNILSQLLKFNCYFSVGSTLMKSNSQINQTLKFIPVEKLLLETGDSIYTIEEIYSQAAKILKISDNQLADIIIKNFYSFTGN